MGGVGLRVVWILGGVMLLAPTACDGGPEGELAGLEAPAGADSPRAVEGNGAELNTFRLNTFRLNTFRLNTFRLNGDEGTDDYIEIIDIKLNGNHFAQEAWLEGSKLQILDDKGDLVGDGDVKHVRVLFELTDAAQGKVKAGRTVALRTIAPLHPGSDVWLYRADVRDGDGAWEPLCVDAQGAATEAILIGAGWDPATGARVPYLDGMVTFACRGAALAKCVEWGYRPWAAASGVSLRDFHQACTRMVRADYCGDGEAHTYNGTPIHVHDALDVQGVDPNIDYEVEAEWGPDGAVCFNPGSARQPEFAVGCELPACGESFAAGGLIQSGKIVGP